MSDSDVSNQRAGGAWRFEAVRQAAPETVGLLFFPGSLVDPVAYAPLARAVAVAGYPVIMLELPRRGAFGGADDPALYARAESTMRDPSGPRRWVMAGHSRGAVVASTIAARALPEVAGLVLIGTTHPRDVDLSHLAIPVTKVVGTRDRIAPESTSLSNRHLLPPATRWVRIEGGNHSQFGWYGFQPFDGRPRIPSTEQREQMIQAVLDILKSTA